MNTTATLAVGDIYEADVEKPYTDEAGTKKVHTFTRVCEVTETNDVGLTYRVVEVLNEQNRPSFAGAVSGGTLAWFAVPLHIARGTMRVR